MCMVLRPMSILTPAGSAPWAAVSYRCLCLCWHPEANLKLVWTKGHDKLGVRETQESHKNYRASFPWEARVTVSTEREKQTEINKVVGPGEEACE
jgi:hypothetical protein